MSTFYAPDPVTDVRIPLILGITGHRNPRPEDVPQLQALIRAILEERRTKHPNTPLVMLSPLAEGADRIAARVALDFGARLVVPLPMERTAYEQDFETPESLAEFRELLGRAAHVITIPLVAGNTMELIQRDPAHRDLQYQQVGAFVAHYTQILIALWDGRPPIGPGGTAQIVQMKRQSVPNPRARNRRRLDVPENGPVYHIVTARTTGKPPIGTPLSVHLLFPEKADPREAAHACNTIMERIDEYNGEVVQGELALASLIARKRDELIPSATAAELPRHLQEDAQRFAVADALAVQYSRRRGLLMKTLYAFPVVGVLGFNLYGNLWSLPWLLALYPLFLAFSGVVAFWAGSRRLQDKHVEYRALAEGLRMQFFWHLAGLEDDVADNFLRQQKSELEWIRHAIRGAGLPTPRPLPDNHLQLTMTYWIDEQLRYFGKSSQRDVRKQTPAEQWGPRVYWASVGLVVAMVLLAPWLLPQRKLLHQVLLSLVGLGPVTLAVLGGYAQQMAFGQQARTYRQMQGVYIRAAAQLRQALDRGDVREFHETLHELGYEALSENGAWVIMHRERPLTMQHM